MLVVASCKIVINPITHPNPIHGHENHDRMKNWQNRKCQLCIKADEMIDFSCMSQFVMLLQYIKRGGPVERFHSFIQVQNHTAEGLTSLLRQELAPYKLGRKLIAQSYDSLAVFSGGKNWHAHFIHSYGNRLNLLMKQASSTVTSAKLFSVNISEFLSFLCASPKHSDSIRTAWDHAVPMAVETWWNFQKRFVNLMSIYTNKDCLLKYFVSIQNENGWVTFQSERKLTQLRC